AALMRLRRYAGQGGSPPLATQAERRIQAQRGAAGRLPPLRDVVQRYLDQSPVLMKELRASCAARGMTAAVPFLDALDAQLARHADRVRRAVLPAARTDFHVPAELYAFELEQRGIDMPPLELAARARAAFAEIQRQMQEVAGQLA